MEWTRERANDVINAIARRAQTDLEFRALCFQDAEAAIAKFDPTPLPAWMRVRFVDNAGAARTFVLPDPPTGDGELSDSELEQVAGGGGRANPCGGSCAVSCSISY
jgi:hypothetical protein